MSNEWRRYVTTSLFGIALLTAGCAARDVDVSQRGPIRGEATVEGDTSAKGRGEASTERERTEQRKSSTSGQSSSSSKSGY
ncbi:MAG TPA: hypothetical protein VFU31_18485 [Candidatus Binatia bacterium]|nr:hypothetical protein [Candidatus Binatia bacterium]